MRMKTSKTSTITLAYLRTSLSAARRTKTIKLRTMRKTMVHSKSKSSSRMKTMGITLARLVWLIDRTTVAMTKMKMMKREWMLALALVKKWRMKAMRQMMGNNKNP